jgi:hypothetical protein
MTHSYDNPEPETAPQEETSGTLLKPTALLAILKKYRCQHTCEKGGAGSRLVDVLTPPDEENISLGEDELYLLADFIAGEM